MSNLGTQNSAFDATDAAATNEEIKTLESQLRQRFDVVEQQLEIGQTRLEMLHPRSADDLIDDEEFNRDERLPYWAEIWPSAYVLAQRIAALAKEDDDAEATVVSGRPAGDCRRFIIAESPHLLELGCGCGLGVMAALAAGFTVTAVDYYPEALQFVRLNALRNGLPLPKTAVVDWRQYPSGLVDFDVVTAADVLYERDYCRLIAAAFKQSLRPGGLGLVTDPQRTKAESFGDECRKLGLQIGLPQVCGMLSVPRGDPSAQQTVNVFEIWRPN